MELEQISPVCNINLFFFKSEHFDVKFVFVAVQNKKVANFLLAAVHNEAHRRSVRGLHLLRWSENANFYHSKSAN